CSVYAALSAPLSFPTRRSSDLTPFPSSVTQQMVENFAAGGAAINQICVTHDLGLKIFDLALDYPTGDITCEPALSERDCAATMRSEEHTSELQSRENLVCRLLL